MVIHVDSMMSCVPNARWRWTEACHLMADSINELHNFARKLGLKKSWFQMSSSGVPHYDLTKGMRFKAIKLGAKEISGKKYLALLNSWRGVQL